MQDSEQTHLVLEASWCIVNLALGDSLHIRHMVESGLYHATHKVICSKHEKLFEQAAWIIANVCLDDDDNHKKEFRNLGCHYPLIEAIHTSDPVKDFNLLKYTVWSLSSLVKSKKSFDLQDYK